MAADEDPAMLSTTAVAGELGCSDDQVRRMCEQGCFDGDTKAGVPGAWRPGVGGQWRIPAAALAHFREARARARAASVVRRNGNGAR